MFLAKIKPFHHILFTKSEISAIVLIELVCLDICIWKEECYEAFNLCISNSF